MDPRRMHRHVGHLKLATRLILEPHHSMIGETGLERSFELLIIDFKSNSSSTPRTAKRF